MAGNDLAKSEQELTRYANRLKLAGVKLTHQRLEVLKEVAGRMDHPDASSIYEQVRKRVPTISLDTVYRTLWMLKEAGLITTLGPTHDRVRFDTNTSPHHHFVCTKCGKTEDFYCEKFNALDVPESVLAMGVVTATQVELRGLCAACAKNTDDDLKGRNSFQE